MIISAASKLKSYFFQSYQTQIGLSSFYEVAIRALKQIDPSRSAFSSIVTVESIANPSLLFLKKYSTFFLTPLQKELNKRTWELLKKAVIAEVGEKKFDAICTRYSLPCQSLELGAPVYLKYIKIFHLGLSQITEEDLSDDSNAYTEKQLTKKIQKIYQSRCGAFGSLLESTPLYASSYSHLFQDQGKSLGVLFSQAKQRDSVPSSTLRGLSNSAASSLISKFVPWLEVFCKRVVNREFVQGQLIPVPGNKGAIQWYKVYAKIASCGLVAYALAPATCNSSLPPLLVFRPTQTHAGAEDFLETLRNDLDHAIGMSGWLATESAFAKLMQDPLWRAASEKIVTAGFSLGGAHMQYFLSQYANDVVTAYSFNSPGVDENTAQKFKERIERSSSCNLLIFRSEEDLVPLVGEVHVGWDMRHKKGVRVHVIQGMFDTPSKSWAHAHKRDLLSDSKCYLHEIEDPFGFHPMLHNGDQPHWLHRIHDRTGWALSRILYLIVLITTAIERITGARLLRQPLQYHWND